MAVEPEFAVASLEEWGAWQRHRGGADAAEGTGVADAGGSVNGPFWPQAGSAASHSPANKGVSTRAAKLVRTSSRMQGIL